MRVLFFLSIGLTKRATSCHLLTAIIQAVCKEGHSVHVIQKQSDGEFPAELTTLPVTVDTVPFQPVDKGNFIARYLNELKYVREAGKRIQGSYDAVFIQSTTVAGFAVREVRKRLPKAVITFNVQDIFPYNLACTGSLKRSSPIFKILASIQRYGYKHSDHVITISEDMKDTLVEDGTPSEKIEVIYNWSYQDEPYENVDLTPVSYLFDKRYFNIVYAGNIGVMQNVDILIEAAKLMKDDEKYWFHIIGNGVYKEKLEARAKEYGIKNITFWPMQPPELAPVIYSAADVNVIPLVKDVYRTALPSKTATCMACGKPIIFAIGRDSQFGQRVEKEAGCVVVDSDDSVALAKFLKNSKPQQSNMEAEKRFFLKNLIIRNNTSKYIHIITGG